MTDEEFIQKVKSLYGDRAKRQARQLIEGLNQDDDTVDENDRPFIRDALIQTFLDAKEYNKRFTPKKYRQTITEA